MKFSLTIKDYIFIGIIFILVLFLVFKKSNPDPAIAARQHTIDSLTTQINQRDAALRQLDKEVVKLTDSVSRIKSNVKSNDTKIKTIYQSYEVKVKSVDDYDIDQLQQFLTDRYADSTK